RTVVSALGLGMRPDPSGQFADNVRWVGPYRVVFDGSDRLSSVELDLTASKAGVCIGSHRVASSSSATEVAGVVPGCGKLEGMQGGERITCSKNTVIQVGAGNSHVELQVQALAP